MNCKPGDLAVVMAVFDTEHNGRVVQVERQAFDGEVAPDGCRLALTTMSWWVDGEFNRATLSGPLGKYAKACFADCSLRPITPPSGSVAEKEVRELYSPSPVREEA